MKRRGKIIVFFILVTCASFLLLGEVPEEVKKLAGKYKGTWKMFGLNEKGEIVKKIAWTDIVVASNPVVKDGRAYVTVEDSMTFEGSSSSQKMLFKEGYILNKDGSLGDYFFEINNRTLRMKKLETDVWAYTMQANPQEMVMLGFSNVVHSKHVVIKVVAWENGVETHRISRVTTISWKDKKGQINHKQFISFQGVHQRQL